MPYVKWFATKEVFVATTKYLSGMDLELVGELHPSAIWKLKQLKYHQPCNDISYLNHLRCEVCKAANFVDIKSICARLSNFVEQTDHNLIFSAKDILKESRLLRAQCMLLDILQGYIVYFIPGIRSQYPPYVQLSFLRGLIAGVHRYALSADIRRGVSLQSVIPGGYLAMNPTECHIFDSDKSFFESLFARSGQNIQWPKDVRRMGKCDLLPIVKTAKNSVTILVDGENTSPTDTITFLNTQVTRHSDVELSTVIFTPENSKDMWAVASKCLCVDATSHEVPRLLGNKSVMDFAIYAEVGSRYHNNRERNFIIVSSDSNFSNLVVAYPEANFTFVCRQSCTSRPWMKLLQEEKIRHYWLDESCSRNNYLTFSVDYLVLRAREEPVNVALNDQDWSNFLDKLNWDCATSSAYQARCKLQFTSPEIIFTKGVEIA